jgi:hypothetical protein
MSEDRTTLLRNGASEKVEARSLSDDSTRVGLGLLIYRVR